MKNKDLGFESKVIHLGGDPEPHTGSIMPAIHQTSTYVQKAPGDHQGYEYSRSHNPTRDRLQECLAGLENAKYSIATSSGMAIATLIMHSVPKGRNVLCGDDVYGGMSRLLNRVFSEHYDITFINTTDLAEVEKYLKEKKPYLLWIETPTNPLLKISDIAKIAKLCKKYDSLLVVDNTFMSPYFQNPLDLGADIVTHSLTKYINGHSDVVGGAMMTNNKKIYDQIWFLQNSIGPSLSPFDSWLVLRGVKTLAVRMRQHEINAIQVAKFLDSHPKIEKVIYPGLKSHPHHALAKKQMRGFGGMITFYVKGGMKETKKFLTKVHLFKLAESLGGVESLSNHPAIMTHASVPVEVRKKLNISDNMVRISVGIENCSDLIDDLKNALK
ncbi:MAG: PLP-dependent transferase [Halobacteriovoraceae bacterium]|nr:PLP-dependent transferase [Halobacteriovoraceae bacterium]